jgi:broad specificity phosphatase PhoE
MRFVESRRHTMRTQPGQHLSQAGVDLARCVGEGLGPFDRVVTSTLPRAFETAIAMGFAVDEQVALLAEMGADVDAEVDWTGGFAEFARAIHLGGATARFARAQAELLRAIALRLPGGGRALVISHGGIVEAGAIGCLPDGDHAAWGRACDYCEGVRLSFDGERFTAIEILRVDRDP